MSIKNTFKEISYLILSIWIIGSVIVGNGYLLLRAFNYIEPKTQTLSVIGIEGLRTRSTNLQTVRTATSTPKLTK